jgi:hypothetical protein
VSTLPKLLIVKLVKTEKLCKDTSKIILTLKLIKTENCVNTLQKLLTVKLVKTEKLCEHTSKFQCVRAERIFL